MRSTASLLVLAACSSGSRLPAKPLGVADHYRAAHADDAAARDERELAAAAEQRAAAPITCGDRTLAEQSTSGGKPISLVVPCWTARSAAREHEQRAAWYQHDARRHRATARHLLAAEAQACAPLPAGERDHSPSWHRDDILDVEPVRRDGHLEGAQLRFRKVDGLDTAWLRAAYDCARAHAAVAGYDPEVASYCPAALEDVTVEVEDAGGALVVTVRSDRDEIAAAAWGRALDLVGAAPTRP